jgi:uncharacterized Zn finger protein (UPF0148 family)
MSGLETCPSCDSPLVQPLSSSRRKAGEVNLKLRCPECEARISIVATEAQVTAYEDALDEGRDGVKRAYDRCVAESMEALADCFGRALTLDLVSADDFAAGRLYSPVVRRLP